MNLANKLTIFRIILVPIMVIIPFLGIQGSWNYIPYEWIIIDLYIFCCPGAVAARQQFFPFIIAQNVSFGQGLQAILRHIPKKGRSKCQKKHCSTP